jgi:uncharacterized damage-inducible protein DinB
MLTQSEVKLSLMAWQVKGAWRNTCAKYQCARSGQSTSRGSICGVVEVVIIGTSTTQISLAHLMQHLANHSTYHRGQVALMMRQLDAVPLATDSMSFWWTAPARTRAGCE